MPYRPGIEPVGADVAFSGLARGARVMAEAMRRQNEQRQQDARLFKAYQEIAQDLGIADKATTTTWDLGQLMGKVQAFHTRQTLTETETRRRQTELVNQMNALKVDQMQKARLAAEKFEDWLSRTTNPTREMIMQAGIASGLASYDPEGLRQRIYALTPQAVNEIPIGTLGVPQQIPGMPGQVFVPTSIHGGQVIEAPATGAAAGRAEPVVSGGKPTGWVRTPEGRYLRDLTMAPQATSVMDQRLAESLRATALKAETTLKQLEELKAKGNTSARIDTSTGAALAPSVWANDEPIEDLIAQQKAIIETNRKQLGTAGPAPGEVDTMAEDLAEDPEVSALLEDYAAKRITRDEFWRRIRALRSKR